MKSRYAYYIAIWSGCYGMFRSVEDGEWPLFFFAATLTAVAAALAVRLITKESAREYDHEHQ